MFIIADAGIGSLKSPNQIGSANPKIGSASPNLKKGPLVRIKNANR